MRSNRVQQAARSFSFRLGVLLFAAILTALMTFRIVIYYESVKAAYQDTQAIINAHAQDIVDAMHHYGIKYVRGFIGEILRGPPDRRLYLAFRDAEGTVGNITLWPGDTEPQSGWREVSVRQDLNGKPLRVLVKAVPLKNKVEILVGYDLYRIAAARHSLLEDAVQNIIISFALSLLLSAVIVWLINRHLLKINRTCENVISGKLSRRVPVRGGGDQFDTLGFNINRMLDWITTLLDTVRDSTNALAHDMRTPLSYHRLELQALSDDPAVPPPAQEKMREAAARVDALVGMFDSILDISKAESRSGTELFAPFDLAEAARDALDFYEPLLEEKNLTLEDGIAPSPLPFHGDEQLVKQAIVNLIDNAVKYTPEGGRISVWLRREYEEAVLTVADNGPGIPPELREKVKERFFRLDKSRNTRGSGLGLSLVGAVAGLHQGEFILEDNRPGLKAVLRLPLGTGQAE